MQTELIKKEKMSSYLIFGAVLEQQIGSLLARYLWTVNTEIISIVTDFLVRVLSPALEFQIDGTPLLLTILFFFFFSNLIQHSLFINFGELCQPPFLFETLFLLIHGHSWQW